MPLDPFEKGMKERYDAISGDFAYKVKYDFTPASLDGWEAMIAGRVARGINLAGDPGVQQAANRQTALGQINAQQAQAASALGLNAGYHMTSINCMMGCEICGIADQRGKLAPPAAKDSLPFMGMDFAAQIQPRQAGKSALMQQMEALQREIEENMKRSAVGRWMVPNDSRIPPTYLPSEAEKRAKYRMVMAPMTEADVAGSAARASTPDAVAGCRLGCSCKVHRPVKPAPYIPAIDDFDLLPDA